MNPGIPNKSSNCGTHPKGTRKVRPKRSDKRHLNENDIRNESMESMTSIFIPHEFESTEKKLNVTPNKSMFMTVSDAFENILDQLTVDNSDKQVYEKLLQVQGKIEKKMSSFMHLIEENLSLSKSVSSSMQSLSSEKSISELFEENDTSFKEFMSRVNCPFCLTAQPDKVSLIKHFDESCMPVLYNMFENPKIYSKSQIPYSVIQILPNNTFKCNICVVSIQRSIKHFFAHTKQESHVTAYISATKSKNYTDFLFCSSCKIMVPNNCTQLLQHIDNKIHKENCKLTPTKLSHNKKGVTCVYLKNKKFKCMMCPSQFVYKSPKDILEHYGNSEHANQFSPQLATLFCEFCFEKIHIFEVLSHFESEKHKIREETSEEVYHLCSYCKFTCCSLSDLSLHMKTQCQEINYIRRQYQDQAQRELSENESNKKQNLNKTKTEPNVKKQNLNKTEMEPNVKKQNLNKTETEPNVKTQNLNKTEMEPNVKTQNLNRTETEPNVKTKNLSKTETEPNVKKQNLNKTETEPNVKTQNLNKTEMEPNVKTQNLNRTETEPNVKTKNLSKTEGEPNVKRLDRNENLNEAEKGKKVAKKKAENKSTDKKTTKGGETEKGLHIIVKGSTKLPELYKYFRIFGDITAVEILKEGYVLIEFLDRSTVEDILLLEGMIKINGEKVEISTDESLFKSREEKENQPQESEVSSSIIQHGASNDIIDSKKEDNDLPPIKWNYEIDRLFSRVTNHLLQNTEKCDGLMMEKIHEDCIKIIGTRLPPVGFAACGLAFPVENINLYIDIGKTNTFTYTVNDKIHSAFSETILFQENFVRRFSAKFSNSPEWQDVFCSFDGSFPYIESKHKETKKTCTFTFTDTAKILTEMLRLGLEEYDKNFILLIRFWLAVHELKIREFEYVIISLLIVFLSSRDGTKNFIYTPDLHCYTAWHFYGNIEEEIHRNKITKSSREPSRSLSQLFPEFLYFLLKFDFDKNAICLPITHPVPKTVFGMPRLASFFKFLDTNDLMNSSMCIIDPYMKLNLAANISKNDLKALLDVARKNYR